jgi:DNA gyrase/topoisomerase IV subunit A
MGKRFKLSEKQAQAILDMRLRRLTGLERDKIEAEYNLKRCCKLSIATLSVSDSRIVEIISSIWSSAIRNPKVAMESLQQRFKLSEKQAQAILDMRLRRLTGLERDKIICI